MKIAIIGAGNMGGAIARGVAQGSLVAAGEVIVADPSQANLDALKQDYPELHVTTSNCEAVRDAEWIILAVKPWLVEAVLTEIKLTTRQILVSVAAGVDFARLERWCGEGERTLFRLIPNTAISELQSMTLVASHNATQEQEAWLLGLFSEMGLAMPVSEEKMGACTALTSCGIAYVLKYIQAAMQAGIEMGIYPKEAQRMVAQSVLGAATLLLNNDTHPSLEIDKVCTPGGITIQGINELEHAGFDSAIIKAMKVSNK